MLTSEWNESRLITTTAGLKIARGKAALDELKSLMGVSATILVWLYILHMDFAEQVFAEHLKHASICMITDYKNRRRSADVAGRWPRFHARSWASNRTMHDKTFVNPTQSRTLITTNNGTLGSWSLSKNRCISIYSDELALNLADEFWTTWNSCRPILPSTDLSLRSVK